jgi:hypothetical protein
MRRYIGRPGALPDEAVIHTDHWGKNAACLGHYSVYLAILTEHVKDRYD